MFAVLERGGILFYLIEYLVGRKLLENFEYVFSGFYCFFGVNVWGKFVRFLDIEKLKKRKS